MTDATQSTALVDHRPALPVEEAVRQPSAAPDEMVVMGEPELSWNGRPIPKTDTFTFEGDEPSECGMHMAEVNMEMLDRAASVERRRLAQEQADLLAAMETSRLRPTPYDEWLALCQLPLGERIRRAIWGWLAPPNS